MEAPTASIHDPVENIGVGYEIDRGDLIPANESRLARTLRQKRNLKQNNKLLIMLSQVKT